MSNPLEPTLFRLRVRYVKQGRLKYLGHLEVIHTVEQIVRRAKLPYAVTQGFSPHMRIAYTSALPVGTSSTCEYYDVYLTELVPPAEALARLRAASPVDLAPAAAAYVELRRPELTAELTRLDYLLAVAFASGFCVSDAMLRDVFSTWFDEGVEIPYRRGKKSKSLNIRQVLRSAGSTVTDDGRAWIELGTHCDNEGSLRPEILIAALDQALRGLKPGVDAEIVSTGIQQLTAIDTYQVERVAQRIVTKGDIETQPLDGEFDAPEGSLLHRSLSEVLSNL